ncbi:tRNA-(ms[2]io[6]A)-hydroxylase [Legionella sp. CNM-4043-24]|uniref:tRNA-(ms[2]io[6]A)-hydroxylase n=1 Tax=Legionella sp. CNM-4043-24 TaxID=3421646 RepID=UPI00403A9B5B
MTGSANNDLQTLLDFLRMPTPEGWLNAALKNLPLLLVDHAHCERKAATAAVNLISKYPAYPELVQLMSPLAREELLHFEKVIAIMNERNIHFEALTPSDYGQTLHALISKKPGNARLRDQLLVGAIIEARSCERFSALVPLLEDRQLARFYSSLLKSEARHFQDYLGLARLYGEDIDARLESFLVVENELVLKKDTVFRFHSGIPC